MQKVPHMLRKKERFSFTIGQGLCRRIRAMLKKESRFILGSLISGQETYISFFFILLFYFFELPYNDNMRGLHCDNSILAYSVP
jgi:hypothetical protein